ncbi:MAG: bifunctional metallophosphatase/5'-nucleotidase [Lachnospiraceae bacterium]
MSVAMSILSWAADQDIVIIYTNDVHCDVDKNIGYAGLELYKKQMMAQTPYVTLVDAGDAIQGEPIGTLSAGGYLIDIMNQVGYDFAIPGNHEFDYGMERFLELSEALECGYYSCNFVDLRTGELVFPAYKMAQYGDISVAFIGVTTPESFTKSTPKYFQDAAGNYIYGFCEDETGASLYNQVQKYVDEARSQGADYVILVSHLGLNDVTERWSSGAVIRNTTGIDACIDGHSHETIHEALVMNLDGQPVLLTQTGTKLAAIGNLTIHTDGEISSSLITTVAAEGTSEIQNGKAVDPSIAAYIRGIQAQYEESLNTVVGNTEVLLTVDDPDTGVRAIRNAETNMGNFTADAYRYVMEAEIGFSNGGGIRSSIALGPVTYNDLLKIFPYGNMGCVIKASGQQIRDALEMASRSYPEENGGFLQVSGLTYTIDTSIPSSVTLDDKQNFTGVSGAYRVTDIMVNGETIDLDRMYTVASHNYMLRHGGDGMVMFEGCEVIKDDTMVDVDILSAYITNYLNGTVKDGYESPTGDGRVKIS